MQHFHSTGFLVNSQRMGIHLNRKHSMSFVANIVSSILVLLSSIHDTMTISDTIEKMALHNDFLNWLTQC